MTTTSKLFTFTWDYDEQHAWAIAQSLEEAHTLLKTGNDLFGEREGLNDRYDVPAEPCLVHDLGMHVEPRGHIETWTTWGPAASDFVVVGNELVEQPDLKERARHQRWLEIKDSPEEKERLAQLGRDVRAAFAGVYPDAPAFFGVDRASSDGTLAGVKIKL